MSQITRRELTLAGLASIVMAASGRTIAQASATGTDSALWYVNPELRPAALRMQAEAKMFPPVSSETLPAMRSRQWNTRAPLPDVPYAKKSIAGLGKAPDVAIYVVNARPGTSRPAILHTHGGGFITGSPSGDLINLQTIAQALDAIIVSVDYRLAPETRYDGSIDDNYAALLWLNRNSAALGADPRRIAVMGESAGGGHAALLALTARDRGEVPLAFQCLTYPMLDDRTGTSRQVPAHVGTLVWTAASNKFGWQSFLGRAPGGATAPGGGVPARMSDLSNLPPCWIGVGSIDLFVQEDMDYARRLIDSGNLCELLVVPGAFHGFEMIAPDTGLAQSFKTARLNALKRGLAIPN